jgi:hypothetical protein
MALVGLASRAAFAISTSRPRTPDRQVTAISQVSPVSQERLLRDAG